MSYWIACHKMIVEMHDYACDYEQLANVMLRIDD